MWRSIPGVAAVLWALSLPGSPAVAAEDLSSIVGTWKLTSYTQVELGTNEAAHNYGEHPTGYVTYTPSGYMALFVAGDERKPPSSTAPADADSDEFFGTLRGEPGFPRDARKPASTRAYVGTYRVEGNAVIYHVESAWMPAWNGTDQVRYFTIEGNRLTLKSEPRKNSVDGKDVVSIATFEKAE